MTSEVEICNMALSEIRAGSINSLTEQSIQAQYCKLKYPFLRDQLLVSPWKFNHTLVALALLTDEVFNWVYTYQYPGDCLKINRLLLNHEQFNSEAAVIGSRFYDLGLPLPDLQKPVNHDIFNIDGNKVIVANDAELRIDYQRKVEDPALFPAKFTMVLIHLLASSLAVPIIGVSEGMKLQQSNLNLYKHYLDDASATDFNEGHIDPPESEFLTIRR